MRCSRSPVSPPIAGALLIATTILLVSVFSKDSMNPGAWAAMAGAYVVCLPRQRCRVGKPRAEAEPG